MTFGYYLDGRSKNDVWPNLMPMHELRVKTAAIYKQYLDSGVGILNRNDFVMSLLQMEGGASFDDNDCYFIAYRFSNDSYPEIADPYLAFQWYGYQYAIKEDYGKSFASLSLTMCSLAQCLMLFGTLEQRASAVSVLEQLAESFCRPDVSTYWYNVKDHILFMAGIHPMKVFRDSKYDFPVVNKEIAIEWYKKLIDLMQSAHDSRTTEWADELEKILGIQYYQPKVSSNSTSSSKAAKQGAGCMVLPMCIAVLMALMIWLL